MGCFPGVSKKKTSQVGSSPETAKFLMTRVGLHLNRKPLESTARQRAFGDRLFAPCRLLLPTRARAIAKDGQLMFYQKGGAVVYQGRVHGRL